MTLTRKKFLYQSLGLASLSALAPFPAFPKSIKNPGLNKFANDELPTWPFPPLPKSIPQPVMLKSVELLKTVGEYFLVVADQHGNRGIAQCNARMPNLTSLLKGLVVQHFVNKDAREVAQLADNAYRLNSNYKYAGMPLWNCIGSVEIAVWDLLGKIAKKPVRELLGKPIRKSYEVYISDFRRSGDVNEIAESLLAKLEATGSHGVKIKVGGRMKNTPEDAAQTRRLVPAVRKILGDKVTIYADANGSYSPEEGVEFGRFLEGYGVKILEEPCNFEDEEGIRQVNQALEKIKLAGGEQNSSAYQFRRFAKTGVYDILQPDLYYNGGILKALQVALIAQKYGIAGFAPHSPKADPLIGPYWQVAALVPNLYGLQETVYNPGEKSPSWHSPIKIEDGKINIPDRNGLGIEYDGDIWKNAEKVV